jgi:hypothetical protein
VKAIKELIPADCFHYIDVTDEVEVLTQLYITEKAFGKASENDAYHIALASVNRVDCLIRIPVNRYTFTFRIFKVMIQNTKKEFDTVAFFRTVKEKMAKVTENMDLKEKRDYWKQLREGKVKLA